MDDQQQRIIQARREVGETAVTPAVAATLIAAFALLTLAVPGWRLAAGGGLGRSSGQPQGEVPAALATAPRARAAGSGLLARNRRLLAALDAYEERLEETSPLRAALLPPFQWAKTALLGSGNQQVYVGRTVAAADGDAGAWLYFRPDVELLTGSGLLDPVRLAERRREAPAWAEPVAPDPRPALRDLATRLAARGIALIVLPVPSKASIHPEGLAPALAPERLGAPPVDPSARDLYRQLEEAEIAVFDPTELLWDARRAGGGDLYLATDSHWRPEAVELVARELARRIEATVELDPGLEILLGRPAVHEGRGDLVRMLRLPAGTDLFPPEVVRLDLVTAADGGGWRPRRDAEVLLLGDSFSNVFSQAELGWGTAAGLAERLALHLRRPVDRIAINGDGAWAPRRALWRAGAERLAGKKIVVYQLAARELAFGDWRRY